ncbi:MAG: glycosyltransferase family 2 protein [Alphaproteobacteria bacterium]|nr:glycosyltransferase family 2 protein [Alphaproteobacteria bacterium]
MGRELPRTLLSLSPPYQDFDPGDYEIVVIDNGSRAPARQQDFAHLKANIRVLSCSTRSPSPVAAINEGLSLARGSLIGVWIDGARMASPGLLRACAQAAALHPRPVIATPNYQLGPDLQRISSAQGYDQAEEDALLASIGWPRDGYRLFDIATPEIRGGPFGAMLESNALFLPRALWDELGGYDEAFQEPGGGVANPDTLLRAVALPDTQLIRIFGEGTFHQIHGGLSTSTQERAIQMLKEASRTYLRLRGKPLVPVRARGWVYDSRTGMVTR